MNAPLCDIVGTIRQVQHTSQELAVARRQHVSHIAHTFSVMIGLSLLEAWAHKLEERRARGGLQRRPCSRHVEYIAMDHRLKQMQIGVSVM